MRVTTTSDKPGRVFLSAAEASGDLHAANLIAAIRTLMPDVEFAGIGGPRMEAAGCRLIDDLTGKSAMLAGTVGALVPGWSALRRAARSFGACPPDLVVLVDSPVLNLAVAKHAKRAGIPTLYYIAPQLWAWGSYRIRTVRRRVDRMAVILPFEEEYFRQRGVEAEFVGHPLFDELSSRPIDAKRLAGLRARPGSLLAIFPGSRLHVVREVLPGQLAVAAAVRREHPDCSVVISDCGNARVSAAIEALSASSGLAADILVGCNGELLSACDLALVASGTITLEAAYYGAPMIVMYNASRLVYWLVGRWFIATKYLCLPNILGGQSPVVPEFMPYYRDTAPIVREALALLADPARRHAMRERLRALVAPLSQGNASLNAAKTAVSMLRDSATSTR